MTKPLSRRTRSLSPRAGLSLLRLAKARALVMGRAHVSPEDLAAVKERAARGARVLGLRFTDDLLAIAAA